MSNFLLHQRVTTRSWKLKLAYGIATVCLSFLHNPVIAAPLISATLDEQVIMLPTNSKVQLETTIFKPPGDGPFPLLIMNHGKALGDPHSQQRDRFIVISREFVKHGYAVVIPMRKGFAKSTGNYVETACDMTSNGKIQADDLQAALRYLVTQRWVDKSRIVVAGQSYGGLATIAFGARDFPGVRGLINFAGGLRIHGGDCEWQASLVDAFAEFGRHTAVPSLWFYGANDNHFSPELAARMYRAYTAAGGNAKLIAYGPFKKDAHGMSGSWEGVKIWWPETERFLKQLGMPTEEVLAFSDETKLAKTDYAALDNVDAVPYLREKGREAYRTFLGKSFPRAFALAPNGAWSWAEDGDDPVAQVLANCEKQSAQTCKLYAVNNDVVWSDPPTAVAARSSKETTGK
jgi:dienelactone hydrolase